MVYKTGEQGIMFPSKLIYAGIRTWFKCWLGTGKFIFTICIHTYGITTNELISSVMI